MNKKLLYHQKNKSNNKKQQWHKAMMMLFEPMVKRIRANTKSKHNHSNLKSSVMNNIYTEQRKTAHKQR